jgi:polyisoprenoid-binding protein YceI
MSTATVATPAITTWNVDSTHSVVEFKVKHMMIANLNGQFTGVTGTLSLHEADVTQSSVEAAIEIASIHTRDEDRARAVMFRLPNRRSGR